MTYPALLRQLDDWFAGAVTQHGDVILCRRGCSACCHGPFDISPADAREVAAGVAALDAATRAKVHAAAAAQLREYQRLLPAWKYPWDVDTIGEEDFDRVCEALAAVPCPALGDDGACLIYASRPATCRLIGLPIETPSGASIANECPILDTSPAYAALTGVLLDLESFERRADACDGDATAQGWVRTTVAGAVHRASVRE